MDAYKTFYSLGYLNKSDEVTIFVKYNLYISNIATNVILSYNSLELKFYYKSNICKYKLVGVYRSFSLSLILILILAMSLHK